jgi:hypothetical protein
MSHRLTDATAPTITFARLVAGPAAASHPAPDRSTRRARARFASMARPAASKQGPVHASTSGESMKKNLVPVNQLPGDPRKHQDQ